MLWGLRAIFWDFLVRTEENKSMKEFVRFFFKRLMFLYQLVNLVLETCFIFSKTLRLSKTFLSWACRLVRSLDQQALWFPYSRLFFWNKMFKKVLILEYLGCFTKSIVVSISDFWHISFSEGCWNCWLVKEIITLSLGRHVKRLKNRYHGLWVFNFFSFGVWREKPL
jgi:hypothetical protein